MPLAKLAARVMTGRKLVEMGFATEITPAHVAVKESVFPFVRFPGVDTLLGPEMKSTGEVMGIDCSFRVAFAKAQLAAATDLPSGGAAFISVRDEDKQGLELNRAKPERRWASTSSPRAARPQYIENLGLRCDPSTRSRRAVRTSSI